MRYPVNNDILTAMQQRDEIHEQARRFNTPDLWISYRNAHNNVGSVVKQAKTEYYKEIIEQNVFDSKALWKSLKIILPGKVKAAALSFVVNGNIETNPKTIAQAFNDFFVQIGESLAEAFVGNTYLDFDRTEGYHVTRNIQSQL